MRTPLLFIAATALVVGGLSVTTGQPFLNMLNNGEAVPSAKAKAMMAGNAMAAKGAPSVAVGQPVVLELFTSQGCSSCPPADAIAARIDDEGQHLVISRPVTYWDRLGWKDTLALEGNTTLQRAYARKGHRGGGVYTPQIVIDGQDGAVGGRESEVRKLAGMASGNDTAAIAIRPQNDGGFAVGINGMAARGEVQLLALDSHEDVRIGRGENGGRTVSYTNVLRSEMTLADWNGGQRAIAIPAARLKVAKADRYAIIVREKNGGAVLAARMLPV